MIMEDDIEELKSIIVYQTLNWKKKTEPPVIVSTSHSSFIVLHQSFPLNTLYSLVGITVPNHTQKSVSLIILHSIVKLKINVPPE